MKLSKQYLILITSRKSAIANSHTVMNMHPPAPVLTTAWWNAAGCREVQL